MTVLTTRLLFDARNCRFERPAGKVSKNVETRQETTRILTDGQNGNKFSDNEEKGGEETS